MRITAWRLTNRTSAGNSKWTWTCAATSRRRKYYLLESLAHAIGRGLIREFYNIETVTVRIRKPHPPVKGVIDFVEVEITQSR